MKNKIKWIEERLERIYKRLEKCDLCPRECGVNRLKGEKGFCGVGEEIVIYTAFIHKGEEPPIVGKKGSGTIFFSGCNLKCVYCQNYKFSHLLAGKIVSPQELAELILTLQDKGAENINLVTPTHFLPQILKSLLLAFKKGFNLPIVYNTSGYEKKENIEELKEIIDIYLPDMKYFNKQLAYKYSYAEDYPFFAKRAIKEMYRQKGKELNHPCLIIRHLVLPGHTEDTKNILLWINNNLSKSYVSVMFQYHPYFKAGNYSINRKVTQEEYKEILEFLGRLNLQGWTQKLETHQELAGVYFCQGIHL